MTLKHTVASLDEIPEGMREHYGPAEGGNGFELQIEGAGALVNALRNERQFRKNAEGRARELETQVRQLRALPPREKMTPREKFFEDAGKRLAGLEGEALAAEERKLEEEMGPIVEAEVAELRNGFEKQMEARNRTIRRLLRENAANDLVMRIRRPGIEPRVLLPLVLDRFELKEEGGEFSIVTKGANGEPVTLEALAEELRSTPALAPLVAGASEAERVTHAKRVAETLGVKPNGPAR
ncbi:MAG TPA: hypothetical protein VN750_12475 [Steroidobacteraceae bacterium]|nr:hypothetical protein [Steroidobacteraceae bacterium]